MGSRYAGYFPCGGTDVYGTNESISDFHFKYWIDVTFLQLFKKDGALWKRTINTLFPSSSRYVPLLAATIRRRKYFRCRGCFSTRRPGAIFWMWLSAFLGMMTNYA